MPDMWWQTIIAYEIMHEAWFYPFSKKGDMMFHKKGITMREAYKFKWEALETAKQFQRALKKGEIAIVKRTNRVEGYPYEIFFEKIKRIL